MVDLRLMVSDLADKKVIELEESEWDSPEVGWKIELVGV